MRADSFVPQIQSKSECSEVPGVDFIWEQLQAEQAASCRAAWESIIYSFYSWFRSFFKKNYDI